VKPPRRDKVNPVILVVSVEIEGKLLQRALIANIA
jgi:hypothetical protein